MPTDVGIDLAGTSAVEQAALVRTGEVSARELVEAVGAQLVAAHGREDLLLSLAGELEVSVGWRPR